MIRPPTFDPNLDNVDEYLQKGNNDNEWLHSGFLDYETILEINKAAEADQARLDALANPITM